MSSNVNKTNPRVATSTVAYMLLFTSLVFIQTCLHVYNQSTESADMSCSNIYIKYCNKIYYFQIDEDVINGMTDTQLSVFFPGKGDRCALRDFLKNGNTKTKAKRPV